MMVIEECFLDVYSLICAVSFATQQKLGCNPLEGPRPTVWELLPYVHFCHMPVKSEEAAQSSLPFPSK